MSVGLKLNKLKTTNLTTISKYFQHHLYPNSLHDLEMALFEPLLCWIPNPNIKGFAQRYLSWIYSPIIYTFMCLDQLVKRTVFSITSKRNRFEKSDMIPLAIPVLMYVFGNQNLWAVLKMWLQITMANSFIFGLGNISV